MSSSLFSRQPESSAADDGLSFESRQPVPTVIVKRRRLAGPDRPGQPGGEAEAPSARSPKVFRVAQPTAAEPAATPETPAQPAPVRRKRDPLKAPVLLRHEVLAPPPAPEPPPAPADYRAVCAALEALRRDVAAAHQARRFKLPLI